MRSVLRRSALIVPLSLLACAVPIPASGPPAPDTATPRWLSFRAPEPMPRPDTVQWVTVPGGATLYVAQFNRRGAKPVLLLHGGLVSGDVWGGEVRRLTSGHRVIVVDTRGHGRSTRGAAPFSYALLAADALAVLDALAVPRAAVIGWSDGGIAGLLLAAEHPSRVAGLLTYGANFDRAGAAVPAGPPDSAAVALGRQFRAWAETEYRRLSPTPDSFPAFAAALRTLYAREPAIPRRTLQAIDVPTTIAAGEHEQFIRRAHTEELAGLIPGARLVIQPGMSHGGPLQDPDGFHRLVVEFLRRARY